MARFRFRLAPVLQLRQTRDDEAQRALAQADRRLRAAQRQLDGARARLSAAYEAATDAERAGATMTMLTWHRNWIVGKTRDVEAAALDVQGCQEVMDVRQREAREARTNVRVLERFRDRAQAAHDADLAHREMTAIDELATLQAARRLGDPL